MTHTTLELAFLSALETMRDNNPRAKFSLVKAWLKMMENRMMLTMPDEGLPYFEVHVPCDKGSKYVHFTFWLHENGYWESNAYAL